MTLPPVLKKNNTDLNLWHVLVIFTGLMFAKIAGSFQEGRFNETLLGFSLNFLSARVGSCLNFLIGLPRSSADLILHFEISFSYKTTVNEDISRLTFVSITTNVTIVTISFFEHLHFCFLCCSPFGFSS